MATPISSAVASAVPPATPPDFESAFTPDWPLDLLRALSPHRRGTGAPTMRGAGRAAAGRGRPDDACGGRRRLAHHDHPRRSGHRPDRAPLGERADLRLG